VYPKFFKKRNPSSTIKVNLRDESPLPSVSSANQTPLRTLHEACDSSVRNSTTSQVNINEEDSDSYFVSSESEVEPEDNSIVKAETISSLWSEIDNYKEHKIESRDSDIDQHSDVTNIDADDISINISTDSDENPEGQRNQGFEDDADNNTVNVSTENDEDPKGQRNQGSEEDADNNTVNVSTENDEDFEGQRNQGSDDDADNNTVNVSTENDEDPEGQRNQGSEEDADNNTVNVSTDTDEDPEGRYHVIEIDSDNFTVYVSESDEDSEGPQHLV
jgi:hypothetical protein